MSSFIKPLMPFFLFIISGCGNSKVGNDGHTKSQLDTSQSIPLPDSIKIGNNSEIDTIAAGEFNKNGLTGNLEKIPVCLQEMIAKFSKEPVTNPPRKVFRYEYNGRTVFYVPALCCDFYSDLYDRDCRLIGHPDGGFTGRGDGSFPDFNKMKKDEKLIWEDKR